MSKKAVSKPYHYPIWYILGNVKVEYVPRLEADLYPEFIRMQCACIAGLRCLQQMSFARHVVLSAVRFQLERCVCTLPVGATPSFIACEIGRTSYILELCINMLGKLKHVGNPYFKELLFVLRFGQTPHKRNFSQVRKGRDGISKRESDWAD